MPRKCKVNKIKYTHFRESTMCYLVKLYALAGKCNEVAVNITLSELIKVGYFNHYKYSVL